MSAPPPMAVAMATPIQAIPTQQVNSTIPSPDTTSVLADPLVSNVLNELEKVATSNMPQPSQPIVQPPTVPQMHMPVMPPSYATLPYAPPPQESKTSSMVNMTNLKQVGVAMLLSVVLFQANFLFPSIYQKFEKLSFLRAYDLLVRVALFGILLYVILTFVPIVKA